MIRSRIEILTDTESVMYDVKIPTTSEEFGTGLAYRDNIPEGTGMLYDYHEDPCEAGMFTPDTRVPVDFIFVDKSGRIMKISTAEPLSKELHKSKNTAWVLEINGGEAKKKGIQVGDFVRSYLLCNEDAFCSDFPTDVVSCQHYGPQVFVKTKETDFMYSYGVHQWINMRENADASSNFDLKLKNYEQQKIAPVPMTVDEAKKHVEDYEKKYKEDFRKTQSEFFIWNHECVIKECPVEDKLYFYIYGKGWEEIEWWDDRKDQFRTGVYISSIKSTSDEAEDVIKKIDADEKIRQEVNIRNEDFINKPDFGEHFEALGNVWDAVGVDDLEKYIKSMWKSMVFPDGKDAPSSENERLFMQYMQVLYSRRGIVLRYWPKMDEDIQIELVLKQQDKYLEFLSAYPLMKGFPNNVQIEGYHTWENGVEGVFIADYMEKVSVSWFDPFYLYTKNANPLHKKAKIMFSGLALKLQKAPSEVITVDHGGLYEVQLKEFLEKNPDKTAADMPPIKIEMGKGTAFLSTSYTAEYEYQAKINHVKTCKLGDKKVYKMEVEVLRNVDDDPPFTINLYAFEHVLNGYKPKKDDFIRGFLWLTGYHVPLGEEEEKDLLLQIAK